MTAFERPSDLAEMLQARSDHRDYVLLAGGTDLMVDLPRRQTPTGVIHVADVPELHGVTAGGEAIRIGACTTMAQLITSDIVRDALPLLVDVAREVGAVQIQERATIGGNVGTSSPVGDTLPALLALDAELEVASKRGSRRLSYAEYCTGYRTTQLADDEVVIAIHIPHPHKESRQQWRKVGTRQAQAISKVMLAAVTRLDADGAFVASRIAFGAVADRPVRLLGVEQLLDGKAPDPQLADEAAQKVAEEIEPIDDVRSTAAYRLHVAQRLARRLVLDR